MAIHKGTELNNINETWNENERRWQQGENRPATGTTSDAGAVSDDLQQAISEEAAEYDSANKEDRLLDGDRATVRDEGNDE